MEDNEPREERIEDVLADVLRKRILALQASSSEDSRVPSPRVFPSEHYRDVLGSILECGDSDTCCLRPKEQRQSIYSQQKLIGRTGRTLYSAGEGRSCNDIIRPFTHVPSARNQQSSSPSGSSDVYSSSPSRSPNRRTSRSKGSNKRSHRRSTPSRSSNRRSPSNTSKRGRDPLQRRPRRPLKNSLELHVERMNSIAESTPKRMSYNDRIERVEGQHPDTFRIKRKRSSKKRHRSKGSDRRQVKAGNAGGDKNKVPLTPILIKNEKLPLLMSRSQQERLKREQEQNPDTFRIKRERSSKGKRPRSKGDDHGQVKGGDAGGGDKNKVPLTPNQIKKEKLPLLMSRTQQERLKREQEQKRKMDEMKTGNKQRAEANRPKLPHVKRWDKSRDLWKADISDTNGKETANYKDYVQDGDDTTSPEYSSWELATNLIKKPLKSLLGAIPPPHILMSYVRNRFPGEEWSEGSPSGRRLYPDGTIFVASYPNGSALVFYPHGGLAIAISAPKPTHQVLVFRDPLEGFYFLDKSLLGGFNTVGIGVVYNNQGVTKLRYDLEGGFQLDGNGQPHRWHWNGAGQRILQKMNPYMSLRILDLDSVHLSFNGNKRGVRLNVGKGHIINLIGPNPIRLSRRPWWWDAYKPTAQSTATGNRSHRRSTMDDADLSVSDSWQCCQIPCCCNPCDYSTTCPSTNSCCDCY